MRLLFLLSEFSGLEMIIKKKFGNQQVFQQFIELLKILTKNFF